MILKCFGLEQYQISAKNILKINIFVFKVVKTNPKKEKLKKPKNEKSLLLIPENIDDRKLSLGKTIKCQLKV